MLDALQALRLQDRIRQVSWYQSLELPGGVSTPGATDTADELGRIPFPASLEGSRCLDVATADGFWAFEMERRGASEVVAIDLPSERQDWPANAPRRHERTDPASPRGFDIAHDALGSNVRRLELSVYDLDPEVVDEFDFVFIGSVLLHLRDPVGALTAISRVLRGELLSVDAISMPLTMLHPRQPIARFEAPGWPLWWALNLQAYRRLFAAANLNSLATGRPFFLKVGPAHREAGDGRRELRQRLGMLTASKLGLLHAWVRAKAAVPL